MDAEIGRKRHERMMADGLRRDRRTGAARHSSAPRSWPRCAVRQVDVERANIEPAAQEPFAATLRDAEHHVRAEGKRGTRRQVLGKPGKPCRIFSRWYCSHTGFKIERSIIRQGVPQIGRLRLARPRLYELAAPDLPGDQAAPYELVIGATPPSATESFRSSASLRCVGSRVPFWSLPSWMARGELVRPERDRRGGAEVSCRASNLS